MNRRTAKERFFVFFWSRCQIKVVRLNYVNAQLLSTTWFCNCQPHKQYHIWELCIKKMSKPVRYWPTDRLLPIAVAPKLVTMGAIWIQLEISPSTLYFKFSAIQLLKFNTRIRNKIRLETSHTREKMAVAKFKGSSGTLKVIEFVKKCSCRAFNLKLFVFKTWCSNFKGANGAERYLALY